MSIVKSSPASAGSSQYERGLRLVLHDSALPSVAVLPNCCWPNTTGWAAAIVLVPASAAAANTSAPRTAAAATSVRAGARTEERPGRRFTEGSWVGRGETRATVTDLGWSRQWLIKPSARKL